MVAKTACDRGWDGDYQEQWRDGPRQRYVYLSWINSCWRLYRTKGHAPGILTYHDSRAYACRLARRFIRTGK